MRIDLLLSPRDGLTLKDARGFDLAGGVTAGGLPWPGPATTAGAARAVVGRLRKLSETYGEDVKDWAEILQQVTVHGPVVLARSLDDEHWSPAWPAPQDALRLPHPRAGQRGEPDGEIYWLEPRSREKTGWQVRGVWSGAPEEIAATEALWLPLQTRRDKPLPHRQLWRHDELVDWLRKPRQHDERRSPQPTERVDIHLAIDRASLAAKDEALFAHATYEPLVRAARGEVYELGLALRIAGLAEDEDLTGSVWRIGGEARFATALSLPVEVLAAADGLTRYWQDSRFLRLMLVTPAQFAAGWRPDWLKPTLTEDGHRFEGPIPVLGRRVALRAAFVDRAWWTSGWDLALRRPKPSVACVRAGAVYYFESLGEPFTAADIGNLWLSSIQQPNDAARRDGFGLVLPGAWPATA